MEVNVDSEDMARLIQERGPIGTDKAWVSALMTLLGASKFALLLQDVEGLEEDVAHVRTLAGLS